MKNIKNKYILLKLLMKIMNYVSFKSKNTIIPKSKVFNYRINFLLIEKEHTKISQILLQQLLKQLYCLQNSVNITTKDHV